MTAPRPTREQVDASLSRVTVSAWSANSSDVIVLAAEVRALRDEVAKQEIAFQGQALTERWLRAELAARTPQPAEPQHNHLNSGVYAGCPACGTDWDLSDAPQPAERGIDERCTPEEEAHDEMCPGCVTCLHPDAAPQPAVPDGEDRPTDAEFDALRAAIASGRGPTPLDGEDVPARLEAAADALVAQRKLAAAGRVSVIARHMADPEVRAAVAAALAGGAR